MVTNTATPSHRAALQTREKTKIDGDAQNRTELLRRHATGHGEGLAGLLQNIASTW